MYDFNNDMNLRERIADTCELYPDTMIMLMKEGMYYCFYIDIRTECCQL